MFAHTRCSHIVWRAYGAAARVLTRAAPELRSPAATFTAASFRQPCAHGSRVPRSCPPHGASCLAADVAANGRCGRAHPTATAQPVARPVSQPPAPQPMRRRADGAGTSISRSCAPTASARNDRVPWSCTPRSSPRCRHFSASVPHGAVRPMAAACPMAHPAPQQLPVLLWSAATSLDAAHKKATS